MNPREEKKTRESQVLHCPARNRCPVAAICASRNGAMDEIIPHISEVAQGQTVWSDPRFEQRVSVIREGIFSCTYTNDDAAETTLSLFGSGDTIGFDGLYLPRDIAGGFFLRALEPGMLCSFPSKPLRRHLESLPSPQREAILSCVFVNPTSATLAQVRILSMQRTYDRVRMLFERLRVLCAREGRGTVQLGLSHGEIADLVASDRVTTSRALHKMEQEGLVTLGYRSIQLHAAQDGEPTTGYASDSLFLYPDLEGGVAFT